jgi:MFS transporter, DHA1 family, multidrug resistance protein
MPTEKRFLDSRSHPHIVTLVVATAFGPLAMNVFLPSLPSIAAHFRTDYVYVQLAVSLYLFSNALLQLAIGPLADRFGRRPVLMFFIGVALVSTLFVIYAPSIQWFLIGRAFQGTAVAGMVISRAAVRDMVGPNEAASMIGYVTMGMTLAPMLGPVAGGFLEEWYGWRASFWLIILFGLGALALVWADMGETLRYRSTSFASQLRQYPNLFASRRFWGYALSAAFSSGAFFAFLGGAPYLASIYYKLPPSTYSFYFAVTAVGYVAGNFLTARFAARVGINRMMFFGGLVTLSGLLLALGLLAAGFDNPVSAFLPITFVGVGNGLTLPSANAGVVSVRPKIAGAASGMGGFIQIGGGAILSVAGGAVLSPQSGAIPLILVMIGTSVAAVATMLYVIHVARTAGDLERVAPE